MIRADSIEISMISYLRFLQRINNKVVVNRTCYQSFLPGIISHLACRSVALPMMDVVGKRLVDRKFWMNEESFKETPGIPVPLE